RCSSEHAVFIDTTNEPTRSGQLSEKFAANAETVLIETACALNQNRVRPLIGADEGGILSRQRRGGAKKFNHGCTQMDTDISALAIGRSLLVFEPAALHVFAGCGELCAKLVHRRRS